MTEKEPRNYRREPQMTTTTRLPQTTFRAIFQSWSLKTKITFSTLAIFVISIWALSFYASRMLNEDMERLSGEQQFSTVSFMAATVNEELDNRLRALENIAAQVNPVVLSNTAALQQLLEQRPILQILFNGGTFVTGIDGTATASIPLSVSRVGINYMDRDFIVAALKEGKATIGRPVMGKQMKAPICVMGAPIRDAQGKVIGALAGVTDLSKPNFLDKITEGSYGKTGGYLLIAPQYRLIVTATNKRRIMAVLPPPGVIQWIDRAIQGHEGSAVYVNPLGVEVLGSVKRIPLAGWNISASLPTAEAFAPIRTMQQRMLLLTIFLTLLAGGLTLWILKRQLAPIFTTIKTLATLSDTDQPPQPLPITRQDEIGELIGGFNRLLETLVKQNDALRESRDQFLALFDRAVDGIFILAKDGRLIRVNESFAKMHGYSMDEVLSMNLKDFDTPEGSQLAPERMRRAFTGEALTFEVEHYHKDGHIFPLEVSASLISFGGQSYVQCFHRDITERKQVEAEKSIMEERLHNAEKMELMGKLAGRVAHDLNNVLGVLSGYSELLTERIPAGNPLREYAANIFKSSIKAAAIVEDLLTLTRRGVRVMEVAKFNKIIADLLASPEFDMLVAYHPTVIVKTDLAKDLFNISGSPVHIEKTIMNLVSNAVEAITDSGEVQIKTENRYIDRAIEGYETVKGGEYVVLTVSDTGRGIPAAELKNIFEPFYTRKSMGRSGTGLGLAIVWGAVQDHHGYIDVQSSEGKGTTFTLYLPATREKAEEEAQKIPIEQYTGQGESVLVVDDVQEQREVATTLLSQLGYSVNAVSSGEDAVEYLKSNKADILVLDMIMEPGIDGLDTYKQVLEINPHQKAIIVSGFSETDRSKEAQKLGAGAYVKKPYLKEKIGMAIRDELVRK